MPQETHYVYDNIEVKCTGKTASRKLRSGKDEVIHEVTPVSQQIGSWRKWVALDTLFVVTEDDE